MPTPEEELDALRQEVAERGLQPAHPAPAPRKVPKPPAHGSLNPTNGASGRTTPVG